MRGRWEGEGGRGGRGRERRRMEEGKGEGVRKGWREERLFIFNEPCGLMEGNEIMVYLS